MNIFGSKDDGEGQPMVANVVVLEYAKMHPCIMDSKAGNAHSRKRKASVNLMSFMHDKGARKVHRTTRCRLEIDKEAFITRMARERGWKPELALQWWEKMKVDPACKGDTEGPPHSPLRLKVYRWMVPDDASESVEENFEEKRLSKFTKVMTNPKAEDEDRIRSEMRSGFRTAEVGSDLATPLGPAAFTYEGDMQIESVGDMFSRLCEAEEGVTKTLALTMTPQTNPNSDAMSPLSAGASGGNVGCGAEGPAGMAPRI